MKNRVARHAPSYLRFICGYFPFIRATGGDMSLFAFIFRLTMESR